MARLDYLRTMLVRYTDQYYRNMERGLSARMYGWIDEYNDARASSAWDAYCAKHGSCPTHDAYDLFA